MQQVLADDACEGFFHFVYSGSLGFLFRCCSSERDLRSCCRNSRVAVRRSTHICRTERHRRRGFIWRGLYCRTGLKHVKTRYHSKDCIVLNIYIIFTNQRRIKSENKDAFLNVKKENISILNEFCYIQHSIQRITVSTKTLSSNCSTFIIIRNVT